MNHIIQDYRKAYLRDFILGLYRYRFDFQLARIMQNLDKIG